jgi:hypothetical protein
MHSIDNSGESAQVADALCQAEAPGGEGADGAAQGCGAGGAVMAGFIAPATSKQLSGP